jgi:hypothetical protein
MSSGQQEESRTLNLQVQGLLIPHPSYLEVRQLGYQRTLCTLAPLCSDLRAPKLPGSFDLDANYSQWIEQEVTQRLTAVYGPFPMSRDSKLGCFPLSNTAV